jgi:tetratricopeptide (TPR) repeat protein
VKAGDLLSADLLNGLGGIEQGLRRRRALGRAGVIAGLLVASVEVALVIGKSGSWAALKGLGWKKLAADWYTIVPPFLLAAALVLFVAARFWIRESRSPFRYTCRLVPFDAVAPTPKDSLPWLRHDLSELLNDRIGRLSFLEDEPSAPEAWEAHVHIAGSYLIREDGTEDLDGNLRQFIELTPRVRIGGPDAAESLAHTVRYEICDAACRRGPKRPFQLGRDDYDKILERVYFSIATRLYKQIREDVDRKIALLPTRYLRATAYLHEAEDYARSNTLDAYDDAQTLYEKARQLYDLSARPLPTPRLRRIGALCARPVRGLVALPRRLLARLVLRFAKRDAMLARTEVGLANVLITRRALAQLSGRRVNHIFAARQVAECARNRLVHLTKIGYPGALESLFDARVTLALVWHYLGSDARAERELDLARSSVPERAEQNAPYLFATALLEPRLTFALSLLRRAVELSPRFEVAQFERAKRAETMWHMRPRLEKTVAESVLEQYTNVVKINPGNIQAWASLGHTHWLLGELEEAEADYVRGLEYKQIKRETFVAGLNYGLARIAAERGRFTEAYGHYVASTTASVGEGVAHENWAENHNSAVRTTAMLERFEAYVRRTGRELHKNVFGETPEEMRILRSVEAFVKNDYGEACFNFFLRTGDWAYFEKARREFRKARKRNSTYVIPPYNLCLLERSIGRYREAGEHIRVVLQQEPKWPEAVLERMVVDALDSRDPVQTRDQLEQETLDIQEHLTELERQRSEIQAGGRAPSKREFGDIVSAHRTLSAIPLGADATEIAAAGSTMADISAEIEAKKRELARHSDRLGEVRKMLADRAAQLTRDVHDLVPHEWLWRAEEGRWEFRWKVLRAAPTGNHSWDNDFGDIHVRALGTWAMTRAFSRVDRTEGGPLSRGRRTVALLHHLETHYSPDDLGVLFARRELTDDPSLAERMGDLVARSLAFDPAHFGLLLWADVNLSVEGEELSKKRRKAFEDALNQRDVIPPVLVWLGVKLEDLEAYEAALRAYEKAAKSTYADTDQARIRIGLARSRWALGRYPDAVESLEAVPKDELPWRADLVHALSVRGQIWSPGESANDRTGEPSPQASAEGRSRWRGLRIRWGGGARSNGLRTAADGQSEFAELPDERDEGYRTLVTWLLHEQQARIASGDTAGAGDAAHGLISLAETRYAQTAPSRTGPLPPAFGPGFELGAESAGGSLPLMRRLALEAPSHLFEAGGRDRFWAFVFDEIPALQAAIETETGVPLPNIGIRANDTLAKGTFRVLVNEIPISEGSLADDSGFESMVAAIDTTIREKLEALVSVDDIVRALEGMRLREDAEVRLIDAVLEDDEAKCQLLTTVRVLLARDMRVDLSALLRDLARNGPAPNIEDIVAGMRSRRRVNANGHRQTPSATARLDNSRWSIAR